ncbi:hypothetical protein PR048_020744 [Dryococelus australis]|uniref:Uncharacterized protein n=1 Tax=Dryococelus australis TaxID=614101 RepID=A0ABQ9H772_9NEOP|nr:hypothetical protein PR048_020744 [Dryococelus australis]
MIVILKPLETMKVKLLRDKYPPMSIVIPLVHGLQYALISTNPKTAIGINLQKNLIDVVSGRFSNMESSKISAKSTLLDPQFKKTAFGVMKMPMQPNNG